MNHMKVILTFLVILALLLQSQVLSKKLPSKYAKTAIESRNAGLQRLSEMDPNVPQQIFVAYNGNPDSFTVSWVTMASLNASSQVRYGWSSGSYPYNSEATVDNFVDPASLHTLRVIYVAVMENVQPKSQVFYRVGSKELNIWSDEYVMTAPPNGQELNVMALYGDLGVVNAVSVQKVLAEVNSGVAQMILHNGDYAYDLHTENGTWGDVFMNDIMPISTSVPYMGTQGNHEGKYNASHYTHRFGAYNTIGDASGSGNNWWFSWEYLSGGSLVHMVAIDTEVYYTYVDENPPPDLSPQMKAQYAWLDADLGAAKKSADWVIVYGHRPLYCSNTDGTDCTVDAPVLRDGINGSYGMEILFTKHEIDIYFAAHEHSYERTLPIFKNKGESQQNHTYISPKFPVYIISGSAGCQEYFDTYGDGESWSMVRSSTYGFGHLVINNATHLYWEQYLNEGYDGTDTLWIIKKAKSDVQAL